VVQTAVKAIESTGLQPRLESTGGGSDASIIHGNGIPCVNLGIGMSNVHSCDEYIKISHLIKDTEIILAIINEIIKEK
jgi:tripeptide aminopeptidase